MDEDLEKSFKIYTYTDPDGNQRYPGIDAEYIREMYKNGHWILRSVTRDIDTNGRKGWRYTFIRRMNDGSTDPAIRTSAFRPLKKIEIVEKVDEDIVIPVKWKVNE